MRRGTFCLSLIRTRLGREGLHGDLWARLRERKKNEALAITSWFLIIGIRLRKSLRKFARRCWIYWMTSWFLQLLLRTLQFSTWKWKGIISDTSLNFSKEKTTRMSSKRLKMHTARLRIQRKSWRRLIRLDLGLHWIILYSTMKL